MAQASQEPAVVGTRRSMLTKTIITFLFVLLIMIGLTLLVIWVTNKPRKPVYFINDRSINNYHVSKDHHLNASYHFVLESFNPDRKRSIYYKKMEIIFLFKDATIASGVINPWHQHERKRKIFALDLASHNVELSEAVSRDLELARSSNEVVLDVKLKGRIRSKFGIWKSRYYHMKVSCVHVVAQFSNSSSNRARKTSCDVDI